MRAYIDISTNVDLNADDVGDSTNVVSLEAEVGELAVRLDFN